MEQPLVERAASYAFNLSFKDLAPDAVHMAKRIVFDSLGTGLGGYQTPLGQKAVTFAGKQLPGAEASILGSGGRSSAEGAAFTNGLIIKILGMDDSHRTASHIAAQVVPAALAMGESCGVPGKELIVAMLAAYELAVGVGHAVRTEQRRRGLDVKGTVGSMAAALAAGRCAGLDAETLSHAVAIAADMSSGTEQYVYDRGKCDTKDLIAGFAARNGVFATKLAMGGFYGPRGALDGDYGFFRAFGPGSEHAAPALANFGSGLAILSTGFKPHGGCRHTHQAVDAVEEIRRKVSFETADVERVVIKTYKYATEPIFRVTADPGARETAGMSIRVATALALVRGSAWPEDYAYWDDPEVRRLRHVTDVEVDPEIESQYPDKNGCRVEVRLKNGQLHEGYVEYAKGEPEFSMTDEELREKFKALNGKIVPAAQADELYQTCMNLEQLPNLGALLALTRARG